MDRIHVKEHLSTVDKATYGVTGGLGRRWAHQRHVELDVGDLAAAEFAESSLFVFGVPVHYDGDAVEAHLWAKALEHLRELHERVQRMTHFDVATLEKLYRDFAAE